MKQFYRDFAPWLKLLLRRRQRFFVGALLVWVTLLAGLSLLGLSGWFIVSCALAGIALAAGLPASLDVYVPGGGIRFFALLRTVARYMERLYNHNTVLTLLADLRYRVFGDLTRLDDASLKRRRASEWLSRLTSDIDNLDNLYLRLLIPPIAALLTILGVSAFIAIWLPVAAAVVAVVLTLLWAIVTVGYGWLGFANSYQQVSDQEELRRLVLDQVQASAELLSYQTQGWHRQKVAQHEAQTFNNQQRLAIKSSVGNAFLSGVTGCLLIATLWIGSIALSAEEVVGPILVMAVIAVLGINEVLVLLPAAFLKLGSSYGAAQRLNALNVNQSVTKVVELPENSKGHSLQFDHVSYTYPEAVSPALINLHAILPARSRVVITGVSGSGKSTLASLVMGRTAPTNGVIHVAGHSPWYVSPEDRAEHFALLTQQTDLFDGTLEENLRIAKPSATEEELWQALSRVALSHWVQQQPKQLLTHVGEKGQQLSGGQARRVALARLMLRNPAVVLLDEPFAGVDAETARHLAASLDQWLVGRTAIFLLHQIDDVALLPNVAYQWRLDEGRLITDTTV
ncbi:thiol reductant ABC exporter subunit CydC [Halomonas sp. DWK9]|uniref:thiol reductant ABC exporter subunit CydC n=1 Tax=Halomonas sp. DWK9 TaxID=3060155 RepID=UPI00287F83F7|nr:thiol reductant ABC exporter subunit CydC [Halomonas sp. DWK9]